MKRMILLLTAVLLLAALFCGCETNKGGASHTNPPRVTSNVTSSPAPVTPTPTVKPTETPDVTPEGTETPDVTPEGSAPATEGPQSKRGGLSGLLPGSGSGM